MYYSFPVNLGQPASVECNLPEWLLEYEGSSSKNKCIKFSDKEFERNYVDSNIQNSTAKVNLDDGKIIEWKIYYKDNRINLLNADTVPVIKTPRPRRKGVNVSLIGNYLMKKDGFIYPIFNGAIRYDWIQTPNLVEMRYDLDVRIKALRKLRLLMYLTGIFAGAVAASGKAINSVQTIRAMQLDPSRLNILETLAK